MSAGLILIVGAIYLFTAVMLAIEGKWALGIVFVFYALSNVGLALIAKGYQ